MGAGGRDNCNLHISLLPFCHTNTCMPDIVKRYLELKKENKCIYDELVRLQEENRELKDELANVTFGESYLSHGKSTLKTKFFTGFPSYAVFCWALPLCKTFLLKSKKLSPGDIFLLILMKLRLGLLNQDLRFRFYISESYVSKLLNSWLLTLNSSQDPQLFKCGGQGEMKFFALNRPFSNLLIKIVVIIDCTEFFCERARNLTPRALTWSNYKHHNTPKVLVGISLTGAVSFLSRAFGGRIMI